MPSRQYEPRIIGRCCTNPSKFQALYNNKPLDDFIILLCSVHALDEPYTKNVIKIIKSEGAKCHSGFVNN